VLLDALPRLTPSLVSVISTEPILFLDTPAPIPKSNDNIFKVLIDKIFGTKKKNIKSNVKRNKNYKNRYNKNRNNNHPKKMDDAKETSGRNNNIRRGRRNSRYKTHGNNTNNSANNTNNSANSTNNSTNDK
jgi:hypothetical protein